LQKSIIKSPSLFPYITHYLQNPNTLRQKYWEKGGILVAEITKRYDNLFDDRKAFLVFLILILLLLGDWF
jgi:hypothetical protein